MLDGGHGASAYVRVARWSEGEAAFLGSALSTATRGRGGPRRDAPIRGRPWPWPRALFVSSRRAKAESGRYVATAGLRASEYQPEPLRARPAPTAHPPKRVFAIIRLGGRCDAPKLSK